MRKALAGVVLAGSVALTGCGGGTHHHHTVVHHVVVTHHQTHHVVKHTTAPKKGSVLKKIKSKLTKH